MAENKDEDVKRLEAAALWYAQLEDNVADREAFEAWRSDPANALAFLRVADTADWVEERRHLVPDTYFADHRRPMGRRQLLLFASAVLCAALACVAVWAVNPWRASASTGVGQRSSLSLPDGGRVDVNTDSLVHWRYREETREVWLDRGEIALTVADAKVPVTLHAGSREVNLGAGLFDVRLMAGKVRVVVLDGEITVAPGRNAPHGAFADIVGAGRSLVLSDRGLIVQPLAAAQADALLAWRNDEIIFDGTTLAEAVADYNRYLDRKIEITDTSIVRLQIGGRFTTKNPHDFLAALQTSFPLEVHDEGSGPILISKKT